MKTFSKLKYYLLIFAVIGLMSGRGNEDESPGTCQREESIEKCKTDLVPYRYSGVKTTHIEPKPYDQVVEIAIPMYYDTEYRFVFNLEGIKPDIKVEVYDKNKRASDRKLLYESKAKHFKYEPDAGNSLNRVYIDYVIPPVEASGENAPEEGCVVLTTGYRNI